MLGITMYKKDELLKNTSDQPSMQYLKCFWYNVQSIRSCCSASHNQSGYIMYKILNHKVTKNWFNKFATTLFMNPTASEPVKLKSYARLFVSELWIVMLLTQDFWWKALIPILSSLGIIIYWSVIRQVYNGWNFAT